jgi:hypothetical protein
MRSMRLEQKTGHGRGEGEQRDESTVTLKRWPPVLMNASPAAPVIPIATASITQPVVVYNINRTQLKVLLSGHGFASAATLFTVWT